MAEARNAIILAEILGGAANAQAGQAHTSRQITGRSMPPNSCTGRELRPPGPRWPPGELESRNNAN